MLSHSMRISIRHLSKMTQPLVQCAGKGVAGRQKITQETVEVEKEILDILCLPCAKEWAGTLKFLPQFCEVGNSPTGERKKLRHRKGKQISYIHYSSWKGSKCFMEMTPWVVEGTCSRENKLENSWEIFNMWHNWLLKQAGKVSGMISHTVSTNSRKTVSWTWDLVWLQGILVFHIMGFSQFKHWPNSRIWKIPDGHEA